MLTSLILILGYGGLFRFLFGSSWMEQSGGVVSMSFIFTVPFACGALSVTIGRWFGSDNWLLHAIYTPCIILAIGLAICIATKLEAMICVIMAAPIFYTATVLGGLLAHALLPRNKPTPKLYLTLAVFIPLLSSYAESWIDQPSEIKGITNSIVIHSTPEKIWPLIASVEPILPQQIPDKWIYKIGFPKPIAATLDLHEIGGVRTATFERDVSFFEEITVWNHPKILSFSIHADPAFIPQNAFDRHIIVGGRFYDVLDGTYEIVPIDSASSRLILTSNHRLSTRFNSYAA